jgi:hypothetical protein
MGGVFLSTKLHEIVRGDYVQEKGRQGLGTQSAILRRKGRMGEIEALGITTPKTPLRLTLKPISSNPSPAPPDISFLPTN